MAEIEQPHPKRPRVEEITTNAKTTTPTTQLGDMSTLVARPQQRGTVGVKVRAVTNQFMLKIAPSTQFFQYEAVVKEKDARDNDPVGLTKNILQSVLSKTAKERFGNAKIAVFPPNLVISGTKLKDPETGEEAEEIKLVVDVPKPNERRKREFDVHLRLTRSAPLWGDFYAEYNRSPQDKQNEMFAMRTSMNVIFHAGQRERALATKGPWHFTTTDSFQLSNMSTMLRSYTQAVVDSDMGMILTFGTSAGCFKKDMLLEDYLKLSLGRDFSEFQTDNPSPMATQKVDRFLRKEKIKCTFVHQTKRQREAETIKGLAFDETGRLMRVKDVFFLSQDAERLVKRMQRAAKDANGGERTDDISLDAIKEALGGLHEKNSLKVTPPSEDALAQMFAALAGGADKVDITKMVHAISPPTSMADYFKKVYGRDLHPHEAVLWTGSAKKKSYHYLRFAYMVAGQPKQKMSSPETTEMIRQTGQKPALRKQLIHKLKREAAYDDDRTLNQFEIMVNHEPIAIEARILPVPEIMVTEKERVGNSREAGNWDHRTRLYAPVALNCWAIMITDPQNFKEDAINSFKIEMKECCLEKGIQWSEPVMVEKLPNNFRSLQDEMVKYKADIEGRAGRPLELLVVFKGPDGVNGTYYSEIKRVGDMVLGIPTTCCNASKALTRRSNFRFNFQYVKGVVLKINAKLGNLVLAMNGISKGLPQSINWAVSIPWRRGCKTMVVGIDVSHPSPGSRQPSVLAVTAQMDAFGHRYLCRYKTCARRMEIGGVADDDFKVMIEGLIDDFAMITDGPPASILIFRDGVSESQFAHVKETEVQAFKDVAAKLTTEWEQRLKGSVWSPKITYVVCQKRSQARFMPERDDTGRGSGNLSAGFVCDTGIVSKSLFDFYLISHAGLQGTSRPVHYIVLEDQMEYTADEIQGITYALCYGYSRCTKSIGCVTPIYYADKIAERVRMYYHESDDLMSDAGTVCSRASDEELPTRYVHANLRQSMFWA